MTTANPVLVEVWRGDQCESAHRGAACVVGADGRVVHAWGDVDRPVYPRSAIKPLQALPFLETGAAEAFGATPEMLALACASHSGEPAHADLAAHWLGTLELSETALACGPHLPMGEAAAQAMIRQGEKPGRRHNNCSGKHLSMITTARHLGEPVAGYERREHPVQQRVIRAVEEMTDFEMTDAPAGIDGCGIPTLGLPLRQMALGFARLVDPGGLPPARQAAIGAIRQAIAAHPLLLAGSDRFDTRVLRATGGAVLLKTGAEAVYGAAAPSLGLGVALKIDDGARRASEVAVAALLRYLRAIDDKAWAGLETAARPPVLNTNGRTVGHVCASPDWLPDGARGG